MEGNLAVGQKAWKHAVQCYRQALQLTRMDGNVVERMQVVNGLGMALMQGGHYQDAEMLYRTAGKSDPVMAGFQSTALANSMAEALLGQGKLREAEGYAVLAAQQHGEASEDRELTASSYLLTAQARPGNPRNGELFAKAVELFRKVGNPEKTRKALLESAKFLGARGARKEAARQLAEARALSTSLHGEQLAAMERELQKEGEP